jgi:hypothetical protein
MSGQGYRLKSVSGRMSVRVSVGVRACLSAWECSLQEPVYLSVVSMSGLPSGVDQLV